MENNTYKQKAIALRLELRSARDFTKKILEALEKCNENTNLTTDIGVFIFKIPKYNILVEFPETVILHIRQVCTGELSVENANETFNLLLEQINNGLGYFAF